MLLFILHTIGWNSHIIILFRYFYFNLLTDHRFSSYAVLQISLALQAWLHLMEGAVEETDPSGIKCNREAQHRYLTWRAEKVISILVYALFLSYILFSTPLHWK